MPKTTNETGSRTPPAPATNYPPSLKRSLSEGTDREAMTPSGRPKNSGNNRASKDSGTNGASEDSVLIPVSNPGSALVSLECHFSFNIFPHVNELFTSILCSIKVQFSLSRAVYQALFVFGYLAASRGDEVESAAVALVTAIIVNTTSMSTVFLYAVGIRSGVVKNNVTQWGDTRRLTSALFWSAQVWCLLLSLKDILILYFVERIYSAHAPGVVAVLSRFKWPAMCAVFPMLQLNLLQQFALGHKQSKLLAYGALPSLLIPLVGVFFVNSVTSFAYVFLAAAIVGVVAQGLGAIYLHKSAGATVNREAAAVFGGAFDASAISRAEFLNQLKALTQFGLTGMCQSYPELLNLLFLVSWIGLVDNNLLPMTLCTTILSQASVLFFAYSQTVSTATTTLLVSGTERAYRAAENAFKGSFAYAVLGSIAVAIAIGLPVLSNPQAILSWFAPSLPKEEASNLETSFVRKFWATLAYLPADLVRSLPGAVLRAYGDMFTPLLSAWLFFCLSTSFAAVILAVGGSGATVLWVRDITAFVVGLLVLNQTRQVTTLAAKQGQGYADKLAQTGLLRMMPAQLKGFFVRPPEQKPPTGSGRRLLAEVV